VQVAFAYKTLRSLLEGYKIRKQKGMVPIWNVNHGTTTSEFWQVGPDSFRPWKRTKTHLALTVESTNAGQYYVDPDKNQVELQVDTFDTIEEADAYMKGPDFKINPVGVDFDPEELLARLNAGESEAVLKTRPASGPRAVETVPRPFWRGRGICHLLLFNCFILGSCRGIRSNLILSSTRLSPIRSVESSVRSTFKKFELS
jgi:hypothetical protein